MCVCVEGGGGHVLQGNLLKLDSLRLLLRSFGAEATSLTEYQSFVSIHAFAKPADIQFSRERYYSWQNTKWDDR